MRFFLQAVAVAGVAWNVAALEPKTNVFPGGKVYANLEYVRGGDLPQSLDLYVPESGARPLPVVVWIHGGAWYLGDKGQTGGFQNSLLKHGYAVASINYRLCNAAPFPAQIDDCRAAIRWLRTHAGDYQLAPQRIGVWGSSAGGHLAALLGVTGEADTRVQAVCDWAGPADLPPLLTKDPNLGGIVANLLGGAKVATKEKAKQASPVTFVSKTAAPFLIMHGDKDNTVPPSQSEILAAALKNAGADCTLVILPGAGHGVGTDVEVQKYVVPFFDKHLKTGPKQK